MNDVKPILAIETSEKLCSTCVYFSKDKYYEANAVLKNSHAEILFDLIDFVITKSKVEPKDFNSVAVSAGPGSFTGLRIGMSAAKGIALAASLPIIPVPSFEALALQLKDTLPIDSEFCIANKVNSDEVYYAKFKLTADSYIFAESLRILKNNELKDKIANALVFGNAAAVADEPNVNIFAPHASYVAEWAKQFGDERRTKDFDFIEPDYLKNFIIKDRKNVK